MPRAWGELWQRSRNRLKIGWLVVAGLVAAYVGAIEPLQRAHEAQLARQTGLAAFEPVALWRERPRMMTYVSRTAATGVVGGVPGGIATAKIGGTLMSANATLAPADKPDADRKLVRTCAMDLIIKNPAESAEKIRQMAESMGGYLENSQINGSQTTGNASLTIRVPASRIEEARAAIRKLGLRIESDRLDAQDVTKDYVDREARLRNLHAQEQQYLAIMRRATSVKDTLEVSEQLNNVRGQIEQEQAEFNALSRQVETVAITVSLNPEADAQVFGLSWRPIYRLKIAARDGLDGLGDYLAAITGLLFYLPTILLWLATILLGAAVGWRILRWSARMLFGFPKKVAAERGAS